MEAKEKEIDAIMNGPDDGTGDKDFNLINTFLELLDEKIHQAKDMLLERFNYICSQAPESAKFMWENGTMSGFKPEEGIRSAMRHGTLVVG